MKQLYFLLALTCLGPLSYSQLRIGILGGPHSASVKEENSIPGYSARPGINLGVITEIPLSKNARWFLQPGIMYMAKGRKFSMRNDTTASVISDTISASHNLSVNYIEIPFNVAYKLPLSKKANFLLSAGPYLGLFYNGKQSFETRIYSNSSFKNEEVNLETGKEPGKVKTIDAGFNARAGFEIGSVMITGFMSQGLTSFYTAATDKSFNHRVKGLSIGFWLNKPKQPERPVPVLRIHNSSKTINTIDIQPGEAIVITEPGRGPELRLTPVVLSDKENVVFTTTYIFFAPKSYKLTDGFATQLAQVAELLSQHPSYNLTIEGHSDISGGLKLNRKLALQRAESVKKYLVDKGIKNERLIATGFGPDKPLESNETSEGRARNRRVELKLAQ